MADISRAQKYGDILYGKRYLNILKVFIKKLFSENLSLFTEIRLKFLVSFTSSTFDTIRIKFMCYHRTTENPATCEC